MERKLCRILSLCRTKSKIVFHILFRLLIAIVAISILYASTSIAATCPSTIASSAAIDSEYFYFTGYSYTDNLKPIGGPISTDLYFLYQIYTVYSSVYHTAIRRVDKKGSLIWMASYAIYPSIKSFSMDANEQSVCFASRATTIEVICLAASTGVITSQKAFPSNSGNHDDIKIWPLSDNSGYYFVPIAASGEANLCKYLFSSSTAQCQLITNIKNGYGVVMLTTTQFFITGTVTTTPNHLCMYKVTYSSTYVDWANQITCTGGSCSESYSSSMVSSDGSTIYSFIAYSQSSTYLYFFSLSVATGSVIGSRYKSSVAISFVSGSIAYGDYVLATTVLPFSLVIYTLSTSTFIIKTPIGVLNELGVELSSGRFVLGGRTSSTGYTCKFIVQTISSNSFFSASYWTMTALPSGTEDILTIGGYTIAAAATVTPTTPTYTNQTVVYVQGTTTTSNIYTQTLTQSLSVIESTNTSITPDLSCSFSGTVSITYSLSNYGSSTVPSWVTINSSSGILTVTSPSVTADTEYSFYVSSIISGVSSPVLKLVKLKVLNCLVSNCQYCSSTSISTCIVCNSGYSLSSGMCIVSVTQIPQSTQASNEANGLAKIITILAGIAIGVATLKNFIKPSTTASLWSLTNYMQMLFLILLAGAFIPIDVKKVIQALKFTLNIYSYIPYLDLGFYKSIFIKLNFAQTNSSLDDAGIRSDGSIYNINEMLTCVLLIILLHIFMYFVLICVRRADEPRWCITLRKALKWIASNLYKVLTFSFYIRNFIEMALLIIICSIYEIRKSNTENGYHIFSFIFAIIAELLYCVFIVYSIWFAVSLCKSDENNPSKFEEFFVGFRPNILSRLYISVTLIRRIIYVALLITLVSRAEITIICIIAFAQFCFTIYLICLRPFTEIVANIISILGEIFYFVFLFCLIFFYKESDWNSLKISLFIWSICLSIMIILVMIIIGIIIILVKFIRAKCAHVRTIPISKTSRVEVLASRPLQPSQMQKKTLNHSLPKADGEQTKNETIENILQTNKKLHLNQSFEEEKLGIPKFVDSLQFNQGLRWPKRDRKANA